MAKASRGIFLVLGIALCGAGIAKAEPVTIASAAQGSSTYNYALAIGKAATDVAGMDLRPQPYDSTSQASTFVNLGQVDFGLENAIAIRQAYMGEGKFKDYQLGDLQLVARLVPMRMVLAVRADSGITSIADLKGKRLPAGFPQAVTGESLISAMLASGGLGYGDVEKVTVPNFTAMAESFVAGDLDAFIHVIGTPRDEQVAKDVGGITPLPMGSDAAAAARVKEIVPVASLYELQPAPNLTTISAPTEVLQYDYFVYTHAKEPDANVAALLTSMAEGKAAMVESVAGLAWFEPQAMNVDIGVPYHPAALAWFKEHGQTP